MAKIAVIKAEVEDDFKKRLKDYCEKKGKTEAYVIRNAVKPLITAVQK